MEKVAKLKCRVRDKKKNRNDLHDMFEDLIVYNCLRGGRDIWKDLAFDGEYWFSHTTLCHFCVAIIHTMQ